jgi:hypothetical protein
MASLKLSIGWSWILLLALLASVGLLSFHTPRMDLPADTSDDNEELFYQQISTIGAAMADAHKRGDQECLNQLYTTFHQVVTDYRRYFRARHPLPDSPVETEP